MGIYVNIYLHSDMNITYICLSVLGYIYIYINDVYQWLTKVN